MNYYTDGNIDLIRVESNLSYLSKASNFITNMKTFREMIYSVVSYFSDDTKGIIYDGTYTQEQIDQANKLQEKISSCTDMLTQIVVKHQTFDADYFDKKV
jgi:hypothetical protein